MEPSKGNHSEVLAQMNSRKFDIFIAGETIDLCAISDEPWVIDQWYSWFNKPEITRYVSQGAFPSTRSTQKAYFDSIDGSTSRIALLIKPKKHDYFIGVASISSIDHVMRQCDFAMIIGERIGGADSLFFAMEAKSRMTEHAFENLGVERVNSGQVIELQQWQRWQILFGFQIEGVLRKKFRKGHKVYDVLTSSCLLEDYLKIRELRGGVFWPGKKAMFELMKKIPEVGLIEELVEWLPLKQQQYFNSTKFSLD